MRRKGAVLPTCHTLRLCRVTFYRSVFMYVDTTKEGRTGYLVEDDKTQRIFEQPANELTKQYVQGAFG